MLGGVKSFKVNQKVMPKSIFIQPEIALLGQSEKSLQESNIAYQMYQYDLADLDRALIEAAGQGQPQRTQGYVKVLTEDKNDQILGVQIVGGHASEMLAEFTLAMQHGLGLNKILSTVHPYPTWAEANKYVAGVWKKETVSPKLLDLARKYHAWRRAG
jgi:pyruvate/2-oxoglutarate dehydrogenase complex dihydrolipoamide dehydrogenase (E3) component